jgi:hypothetical protein
MGSRGVYPMADQNGQSFEENYRKRLAIEEFLIDFLGGLVPGVLFLGATVFALFPPLHALTLALWTPASVGAARASLFEVAMKVLQSTANTPSAIWFMMLGGGMLLAYVSGHLFYRHDPKRANRSSFRRLIRYPEFNTLENVSSV